ncbi:MAG: right-handed parallel beta-helix repeat-containing protein [Planctomycetota bacterium]
MFHPLLTCLGLACASGLFASGCVDSTSSRNDPLPPANPLPANADGRPMIGERIEVPAAPRFEGLAALRADAGALYLEWRPAVGAAPGATFRYLAYLATESGKQDFERPSAESPLGATSLTIRGVRLGFTYYVVVHAVDPAGVSDDNRVEWAATIAPVRYVNGLAATGGDGSAPDRALRTIEDAVSSAIALDGINIYVAAGRYEECVFLFDGMMLYGGFNAEFTSCDPVRFSTVIDPGKGEVDAVTAAPGESLCGFDGFELLGNKSARRGVLGNKCLLRITRNHIHQFRERGIEIRGEDDRVTAHIEGCLVSQNLGEGVLVRGPAVVVLRASEISDNDKEGLEVAKLTVARQRRSEINVERCRIYENADLGIDMSLETLPDRGSVDGKLRIAIEDCEIYANKDHGISIDAQFADADEIDLRVRVHHNTVRTNGKAGVHFDVDADGGWRLSHNDIAENSGAGILVTGDSKAALVQLHDNRVEANKSDGVRLEAICPLLVRASFFLKNQGAAVRGPGRWIDIASSELIDNLEPFDATRVSYSRLVGDRAAAALEFTFANQESPASDTAGGTPPGSAPLATDPVERTHRARALGTVELEKLSPPPGRFLIAPVFVIEMNNEALPEIALSVGGARLECDKRIVTRRMELRALGTITPGDTIRLELLPTAARRSFPWHYTFDYKFAATLPDPGGQVRQLPSAGSALLEHTSHRYTLHAEATIAYHARLRIFDGSQEAIELRVLTGPDNQVLATGSTPKTGPPGVIEVTAQLSAAGALAFEVARLPSAKPSSTRYWLELWR